jgi:hypothetical protein
MRSRFVLAALALVLLAGALPAFAAAPIGSFDGKKGGGNASRGLMPVTGWALDDNGIAAVDVVVDGTVHVRAIYGLQRPDVTRRRPGFPNSAAPGFAAYVDTTHFLNGKHQVSAVVTSSAGEVVEIGPVRTFTFSNAEHLLAPFGEIEFPQRDAVQFGQCDEDPFGRRFSVISGYALDAASGESSHDFGVAWVELLIDGALWINTRVDCTNILGAGGLSNCYGLQTPGLTYVYPTLKNSDRARFRFVIDVGTFIASGLYNRGHHVITIRAGDGGDNTRTISSINTFWACTGDFPNEESIGAIEFPHPDQPWAGTIAVRGWALDKDGVSAVILKVNGQVVGTATLGGQRLDIADFYPTYPASNSAGWQVNVDTTQFLDGPITFEVIVRDSHGADTLIGEHVAIIDNRD